MLIAALHTCNREFITDTEPLAYYDNMPPPVLLWGRRAFVLSIAAGAPIYLPRENAERGARNAKRAVEYCEVWALRAPAVEPSDYDTSMPNPIRPFNVGPNGGDANIVDNLRRSMKRFAIIASISDEKLAEAWSDYSGMVTGDELADEIGFSETLEGYRTK